MRKALSPCKSRCWLAELPYITERRHYKQMYSIPINYQFANVSFLQYRLTLPANNAIIWRQSLPRKKNLDPDFMWGSKPPAYKKIQFIWRQAFNTHSSGKGALRHAPSCGDHPLPLRLALPFPFSCWFSSLFKRFDIAACLSFERLLKRATKWN